MYRTDASTSALPGTAPSEWTKMNPSDYLKGLGWKGEGTGLTSAPHARSKPVTVAQKKGFSGVGKDRDTSFAWWDMVFETVAKKAGGAASKSSDPHRTATGILSPLPPPKPSAYASGSSRLNMDALGDAKMEAARRQLYSGFLRGEKLGGTADEVQVDEVPAEKVGKRRRSLEEESLPTPSDSDKEEKKRKKKLKKRQREAEALTDGPTPEGSGDEEAKAEARRLAKEERRLAKFVRRAFREQERAV